MFRKSELVLGPLLGALFALAPAHGASPLDPAAINRIADAEFNHGELAETAAYLADRIGGRLTNSPAMREAERWTAGKFRQWGLKNVHTEGFEFGRGWWIESAQVRMVAPRALALRSIPIAWTPGTNGPLQAAVIVAPMKAVKDFEQWKGKLAGKIVLISYPEPPKDPEEAAFKRLSDADIGKLNRYKEPQLGMVDGEDSPVADVDIKRDLVKRIKFGRALREFLEAEGAVAWAQMSRSEGRIVHGEGYFHQVGRTPQLPAVEIAAEDYRRIARLAKVGEVRMEIDSRVHFEDADSKAYNVVAEIPGSDAKSGFVMAGAHLDSWVAGDGAADNGAGSVVVMEAARILASLDVKPKRTVRFALWAGEEQGLLGSSAYVEQHLAQRPAPADPDLARFGMWFAEGYPIKTLAEFSQLSAYFNVDNGSGKIRGIYAEGNLAAVPILREWLGPLASMGTTAVVAEPTDWTDHVLMNRIGLPAFQFIQDPLDYESRVHHTDLDTFDHLRIDDLRQASVVLATVLLDAANSDTPMPRVPLPTEPRVTDPFHYDDPAQR